MLSGGKALFLIAHTLTVAEFSLHRDMDIPAYL